MFTRVVELISKSGKAKNSQTLSTKKWYRS